MLSGDMIWSLLGGRWVCEQGAGGSGKGAGGGLALLQKVEGL